MAKTAAASAPALRRTAIGRWLIYGLLIAFAAFYLTPLLVVVLNSVRTAQDIGSTAVIGFPHELALDNFSRAWSSYCIAQSCTGISPYMWNSFLMVVPATIISTLLGALNGYSIALWRFRGDNWVFGLITLGVFLPEQMKLIPWTLILRDLGLTGSILGLVLIHVVQGISFTTLFCRNYYVGIPPELLKAARIDGAGYFRIFWRIVLPLSPPILIVTVIWQFTHIWNEFLYGVTFTSGTQQPVTAALIALSVSVSEAPQYGVQSAAVLLAALPTLLVYFFGGKYFLRGLTAGAVK
ncbi:carbohydrate ABC transporter permease [Teichococcus vastitatis]|uniref:Carbohydrate ABC transporter permease n=1 Tax=Teichococcus vastitatis TaxID=2307076 RepID=A0ABS9W747_9PROT|nr:carbohydrate ABC transporter permease [Pseudoroseomonas vastitatis]MCI0754735.1 carbohydrate ABC transporter permease [Pseudoroseomonas vastitatis]